MATRKKESTQNAPSQENKKAGKKPKGKVIDVDNWFGCLLELEGDSLEIQRKMRAEWDREWDRDDSAQTGSVE